MSMTYDYWQYQILTDMVSALRIIPVIHSRFRLNLRCSFWVFFFIIKLKDFPWPKQEYDLQRRGWGRLTACISVQHQQIKLSLLHRNQILLTQPSLFRDFSGCIPRGVHGFGSIWQQTQRQSLTQRHLQVIFSMEAITADWPRLIR